MSFAYVVCLWSCWNSGYELDIVATTRSNRVLQSFSFVSFSFSTELLEDKQGFKLAGVDTSPTYLLFRTLLPLFWTLTCMIWMELTRIDAVFSRLYMVLFMCRNKKFSEWPETPWNIFLENIKNTGRKIHVRGPTPCPQGWGGACPPGRAPYLVGPLTLHRPQLQLHIFTFGEKKSERKNNRVLQYGAAAKP